jgi:acetyl-CoA carboxylase carboxyl transferase subunit alpha
MGITAERLQGLKIVDQVIAEPLGGAHRDVARAVESIRETLTGQLDELLTLDTDELLARRYAKLMGFGIA